MKYELVKFLEFMSSICQALGIMVTDSYFPSVNEYYVGGVTFSDGTIGKKKELLHDGVPPRAIRRIGSSSLYMVTVPVIVLSDRLGHISENRARIWGHEFGHLVLNRIPDELNEGDEELMAQVIAYVLIGETFSDAIKKAREWMAESQRGYAEKANPDEDFTIKISDKRIMEILNSDLVSMILVLEKKYLV